MINTPRKRTFLPPFCRRVNCQSCRRYPQAVITSFYIGLSLWASFLRARYNRLLLSPASSPFYPPLFLASLACSLTVFLLSYPPPIYSAFHTKSTSLSFSLSLSLSLISTFSLLHTQRSVITEPGAARCSVYAISYYETIGKFCLPQFAMTNNRFHARVTKIAFTLHDAYRRRKTLARTVCWSVGSSANLHFAKDIGRPLSKKIGNPPRSQLSAFNYI